MKKLIITLIGAALIASSTYANHHIDGAIRDGIIGGIIGGVIGNNTGSGDSETGALIGAVSGITNGILNRSHRPIHHPRRVYTPRHSCSQTTVIYDKVWVRPVYNYDVYGNRYVIREGNWKTVKRHISTPRGCCP